MPNVLDPVIAALTAALVGVAGPTVAPTPPPTIPTSCLHWTPTIHRGSDPGKAAMAERIHALVDDLTANARDNPQGSDLAATLNERIRASLPTPLPAQGIAPGGPSPTSAAANDSRTPGASASSNDCTAAGSIQRQAGLEVAAVTTALVDKILAVVAAAGAAGTSTREGDGDDGGNGSENDNDDGSDNDERGNDEEGGGGEDDKGGGDDRDKDGGGGGDGGDKDAGGGGDGGDRDDGLNRPARPAPAPIPPPAPPPASSPAPAVPAPAPPGDAPAPPGDSPAAVMEKLIQDLASALKASSDPAMQKLGDELLGVLGGTGTVPRPLPAPTDPTAPTTSGTGTPSVLPSGATPLFTDDFEGGDLGKWGSCQGAGVNGDCAGLTVSDGMGVGQDPERGMVAQFKITDGVTAEMGGERSEVRDDDPEMVTKEGDDRWYSWSMKFPADFPEPDGGYYIVMQWHQSSDSGSPPLALDITQGSIDIGGDGVGAPRQTIGPIRRGEWVDYVLHAGFSRSDGFVEAWENGKQTVQKTSRPTMTDAENYIKMGIYRDEGSSGDAEVWFDDFAIHDGAGGVGSPRPAEPPAEGGASAEDHPGEGDSGGDDPDEAG